MNQIFRVSQTLFSKLDIGEEPMIPFAWRASEEPLVTPITGGFFFPHSLLHLHIALVAWSKAQRWCYLWPNQQQPAIVFFVSVSHRWLMLVGVFFFDSARDIFARDWGSIVAYPDSTKLPSRTLSFGLRVLSSLIWVVRTISFLLFRSGFVCLRSLALLSSVVHIYMCTWHFHLTDCLLTTHSCPDSLPYTTYLLLSVCLLSFKVYCGIIIY